MIVSVFQVASQQPLLAVSLSDGIIDEEHIGNLVCDMATQPDMQWLRTENSLRVVDRESATPSTALLLAELHADRVLITPVFGQGEFVGCIVAKLPHAVLDALPHQVFVDGILIILKLGELGRDQLDHLQNKVGIVQLDGLRNVVRLQKKSGVLERLGIMLILAAEWRQRSRWPARSSGLG